MEEEEEGHKQQIILRIESHLRETSHISQVSQSISKMGNKVSLRTNVNMVSAQELGIKMPQCADQNAPLYQVEKSIREELRKLQRIKEDRLQKYSELKRQVCLSKFKFCSKLFYCNYCFIDGPCYRVVMTFSYSVIALL